MVCNGKISNQEVLKCSMIHYSKAEYVLGALSHTWRGYWLLAHNSTFTHVQENTQWQFGVREKDRLRESLLQV